MVGLVENELIIGVANLDGSNHMEADGQTEVIGWKQMVGQK